MAGTGIAAGFKVAGTPVTMDDGTTAFAIQTSGGGGGAATIADGADVAEGATTATSYADGTGAAAGTTIALLKGNYVLTAAMSAKLPASLGTKTAANSLSVTPSSDGVFTTQIATGTNSIGNIGTVATVTGVTTVSTVTTVGTVSSVSAIVAGTGATNLGKAEDAASVSGDTGVFTLGIRRDALVVSTSATGDYNEYAVDKYGSQQVKDYEKQARTYSASANITVAAAATDIAILPGSATTTVFVTRIIISGIQTTAGEVNLQIIKRSTANTGGTSAAMTAIPHDSGDAAATAAPLSYTANPTPGTTIGSVRQMYIPINLTTTQVYAVTVIDFGDKGKPVTLNGIAQGLAVNLGGATLAGGAINVVYEWFEI